jgi:hypothetical protein
MDLKQFQLFLVRYVPDPVRNEFVNIGVLLRDASEEGGETRVRFTRNWRRARCMEPDIDTAHFESLEADLQRRFGSKDDAGMFLDSMLDSWSNTLQLSNAQGCLAENLAAAMDKQMQLYVEPRKREPVSRKSGRQVIYTSMRTQFERAGVWDLMRKRISVASYTRLGDPLRIDCGYRPNGVIRMFHAVSLEGDLETAKVLAFSVDGLRKGILAAEQAELELTAVVEPLGAWERKQEMDQERMEQYTFARETMEQAQIRVMTTADLPRIAETAKLELRV